AASWPCRVLRNKSHLLCADSVCRSRLPTKHIFRRSSQGPAEIRGSAYLPDAATSPQIAVPGSRKRALEKYFRILLRQALFLQAAVGTVPLINPVDHSQQCEGS